MIDGRGGYVRPGFQGFYCGVLVFTTTSYRGDIDGLRAIAVALVIVFHAFPESRVAGFIGVDVFFVISGYLITGIIQRELAAGTFTLRHFYSRRIRRIFPALIIVLAVSFVIAWQVLLPTEMVSFGWNMLGGAAFVSNFVLWNEAGYFDAAAQSKPLLHLWSLGIEEQFYIVWPLALLLLIRFGPVRPLVLAAASVVLAIAAPAPWYGALLGGATVALWSRHRGSDLSVPWWLGGAAILLLGGMMWLDDPSAYLPIALAAPIAVAWLAPMPLVTPMAGLGRISYGLYIWHYPVALVLRWTEMPWPVAFAILLPVGIALALLSWVLLEQPFLTGRPPQIPTMLRRYTLRSAAVSVPR